MRRLPALLSLLLACALLGPAPAVVAQDDPEDPPAGGAELVASPNMSHVATVAYDAAYPEVSELPYGTDIEFATLTPGGPRPLARLAGPTRVETAVAISRDAFPAADTVVVATGADFADALAAGPLAAALRAPVLLSGRDALPEPTAAEITRLGASRAVLLGGEAALGSAVADALDARGLAVERIAGDDRYGTAAAIAERLLADGHASGEELLVAGGEGDRAGGGFQSALGASALGAAHGIPLLLVGRSHLPQVTADLLDGAAVTVAAEDGELDAAVHDGIAGAAASAAVVGGPTTAATSVALAAASVERGASAGSAWLATARAFPDALAAGPAVAAAGGVLLLVDGLGVHGSPETWTALESAELHRVRIAGGPAAVVPPVEDAVAALLPADPGPRRYAIAGTYRNGLQVVDITDPEAPEVAAVYGCGVLQGDVQVFTQGERTLATYTSEDTTVLADSRCVQDAIAAGDATADQATQWGTYVVDLTDPLAPRYGGFIPVPEGSHNGTVHPSGDFFYNSDSTLITDVSPQIQVYDISALPEVERVAALDLPVRPGLGTTSHDITFDATGDRAYSAALSQTVILDTTDPADPQIVSSFIDPAINVEHQADPIDVEASDGSTRRLLLVEDELAGAAGNGTCPGGGVHIYDITGDNELEPMLHKVGTYFIPDVRPAGAGGPTGESLTCTAHVFRIHPEQQVMTIAWYNAGAWVLDLSGLADAAQHPLSQPIETLGFAYFSNSDTWSFKTDRIEEDGSFYGYTGDIVRGMDVFRFDAAVEADDALAPFQGRLVGQAEAVAIAQRAAAAAGADAPTAGGLLPRCLLLGAGAAEGQGRV